MSLTLTDATKDPMLDGIDSTFNSGKLRIYTGAPPGASAAVTGTLLVEESLGADWASAAASGSKAIPSTLTVAATGTGTAGYYRIVTSADTDAVGQTEARIEGTVTATGGGGDMELDNTSIASGQTVNITSWSISI